MTAPADTQRKVLDLFAGAVGGWSIGMHRAGFNTAAACEIDPWRRQMFSAHFPEAKMYDDVHFLTADRLLSNLGWLPKVIVGSPPCQDASAANTKGRGVDGGKTALFFEAIRLVRECRPRWVAFENSPRLRTRGYDRVADALEAIGYACWPLVVGADDIGAPHERKRVWIIAADTEKLLRRSGLSGPDQRQEFSNRGRRAVDSASVRSGSGRARRCREDGIAGASTPQHAADTIGDGIRIEPGRSGRPNGPGQAVAQNFANPDQERRGGAPSEDDHRNGDAGQFSADLGGTDGAGLSLGESLGSDACAQLAALERAIGPIVHTWHGGAARHLGMAHGTAARLARIRVPEHGKPGRTVNAARACIAAQGDAILPQIAEAIGRAIMRVEAAIAYLSSEFHLQTAE